MAMEVKAPRRVTDKAVFNRPRRSPASNTVCSFWLAGRCYRWPCRFLHTELPPPSTIQRTAAKHSMESHVLPDKESRGSGHQLSASLKNSNCGHENSSVSANRGGGHENSSVLASRSGGSTEKSLHKTQQRVCQYWVFGNCVHGDKCKYLHSWFCGEGFSMLAKLEGHKKVVSGIAFPSGSDKLFTGSKDGTVRVWDCHTGQCASVIDLGGEIGSLISEGPWIFVGMPNTIKAWNTKTNAELSLCGSFGQVYAMVVGNDMLFAGAQDGTILACKADPASSCSEVAASLKGHSCAVVSLVVGANRLYSGSMDHTIKVWDLETLQCIQTLNGHSAAVMSLICWDQFLLSCSLDQTIMVWATTEGGNIEVIHTRNEEHGVLALSGINDAEAKPILLCSCNDNIVHLYDLPSFTERGRLFTKREVHEIQIGPGGLFFTGDGTGQVTVWNLFAKPVAAAQ